MEMNSMIQGGASITTNVVAPETKVAVNAVPSTVVSSTSESGTNGFGGNTSNPSEEIKCIGLLFSLCLAPRLPLLCLRI